MGVRLTKFMQSLAQFVQDPYQQEAPWRPAADIYRIPGGWLAKFDLAGICPQEVELSVAGRTLTISGARRDRLCQHGHRSHSMEIFYSRFQRSIELPGDLDDAQVTVEYKDGMFIVRLITGEPEVGEEHKPHSDCTERTPPPAEHADCGERI